MGVQTFVTKVRSGLKLIPQPDAFTCQAACIAMATDRNDTVSQVRQELVSYGVAGDPAVMGRVLRRELGSRYDFEDNATQGQMRDWIRAGEFLITHGWLSQSGHVIALNGVDIDQANLSYRFHVLDPYAEFMAKSWRYNNAYGYDGFYSSYLIYATCVASQSYWDAERIYRRGELNSNRPGAWVHRVKP